MSCGLGEEGRTVDRPAGPTLRPSREGCEREDLVDRTESRCAAEGEEGRWGGRG